MKEKQPMGQANDQADGLSRRKFLSLASTAAAVPVAATYSSAARALEADAPTVSAFPNQQVKLKAAYAFTPGPVAEAQELALLDADRVFVQGNKHLNGRELRITFHGLGNAGAVDLSKRQLEASRPCATESCGVITHVLWDANSGGAEFSYVPEAGDPLVLDLVSRQDVSEPLGLALRVLSGNSDAPRKEQIHRARLQFTTGTESDMTKLHVGHYFFGVPGLSHDADLVGKTCAHESCITFAGPYEREQFENREVVGLSDDVSLPYFMITVREA